MVEMEMYIANCVTHTCRSMWEVRNLTVVIYVRGYSMQQGHLTVEEHLCALGDEKLIEGGFQVGSRIYV